MRCIPHVDTDTLIRIIVLICLLVLSAFFSSAETALTAVSPIRIRNLLDQNPSDKRAAAVMRIIDDPSPMLGTILVANNAVNLSASAITASLAYRFGGKHLALATGIITLLILVFGEITPKTIATIRTEKMALAYARPLIVLMTILTPIVFLINAISNGLLKLLGVSRDDAGKLTQGDIQTIVDVGHEEGIIQSDEKDIITNVFELKDSAVKEVMVPRVHVSILDADISFEELLKVCDGKAVALPKPGNVPSGGSHIDGTVSLDFHPHSSLVSVGRTVIKASWSVGF